MLLGLERILMGSDDIPFQLQQKVTYLCLHRHRELQSAVISAVLKMSAPENPLAKRNGEMSYVIYINF